MMALNDVTQIVLDQANLKIDSVIDDFGNNLNFQIENIDSNRSDPVLGSPLVIFPQNVIYAEETPRITIVYETTGNDSALSWLTPQQTAGKRLPYVYSQNEPAYGRSWFPCQDTPSVKTPYFA